MITARSGVGLAFVISAATFMMGWIIPLGLLIITVVAYSLEGEE
jgi:hypothetical protein